MMFFRSFIFFLGVLATFILGWVGIVNIPDAMISRANPGTPASDPGPRRYTAEQLYGRSIYIREGCIYCHSQQVRPHGFGVDQARFWGRPSVPADYIYDQPQLLGTMRTGPDLMNIGARQSDLRWHYLHLYNARLVTAGSIIPPYPWLFEERETAGPTDMVLQLPDSLAPQGRVVVPNAEGRALVVYLLSLNHNYPVQTQEMRTQ